ncbi:unnamed protein product, partial [Vitis vinifera]
MARPFEHLSIEVSDDLEEGVGEALAEAVNEGDAQAEVGEVGCERVWSSWACS